MATQGLLPASSSWRALSQASYRSSACLNMVFESHQSYVADRRPWLLKPEASHYLPRIARSLRTFHSSPMVPDLDVAQLSPSKPDSSLSTIEQITFRGPEDLNRTHAASQIVNSPSIRNRLKEWEQQLGNAKPDLPLVEEDFGRPGEVLNTYTRPRGVDSLHDIMNRSPEEDLDSVRLPGNELYNEAPLKCGDLVELTLPGTGYDYILAIVIQHFETQTQYYAMNGKWAHRLRRGVNFVVPDFVSPKLVKPLLPKLPTGEIVYRGGGELQGLDTSVPREIGAPLIERMLAFYEKSESVYRKRSEVLDKAHEVLSHDSETLFMTLPEVTKNLLRLGQNWMEPERYSPEEAYAVHKALMRSDTEFVVQGASGREHRYFMVYSKFHVKTIKETTRRIRQFQEFSTGENAADLDGKAVQTLDIFEGFIKKARRAIKASRLTREATHFGAVGPDIQQFNKCSGKVESYPQANYFTKGEKDIIRFIESFTAREFPATSTLNSLAPAIMRATGMYDGYKLNWDTAFTFLQELGVYTPWDRRSVHSKPLGLPGHYVSLQAEDDLERIANLPENFASGLTDSMAALRKDWGNLRVYCIDGADAKEIDDGISIERIQGTSAEFWVHIHVANPSAFLPPDSWLALRAQNLVRTIYTPDRTYPMLPTSLVEEKFSLGANRPALTFSARLTSDGELVDYRVTPGVIRQVKFITPDTLDDVLGLPAQRHTVLSVGGAFPSPERTNLSQADTLSQTERADLESFMALAAARRRRRVLKGALSLSSSSLELSVSGSLCDKPPVSAKISRGYLWRGDPMIELRSIPFDPTGRATPFLNGRRIVEEFMVLASEVAGKWCQERNLPVEFVSNADAPNGLSHKEFIRQEYLPSLTPELNCPMLTSLKYLSRTVDLQSTTAGPAIKFGVDVYARCSSPLRRYMDLVLHWQVEAALRHEARYGDSFAQGGLNDHLPFSKSKLDELALWIRFRGRRANHAFEAATKHWTMHLLTRAHVYGETLLPKTFEMFVLNPVDPIRLSCYGILKDPAVTVRIEPEHGPFLLEQDVQTGDFIEVEIETIDIYQAVMTVKPVRMISKADNSYN